MSQQPPGPPPLPPPFPPPVPVLPAEPAVPHAPSFQAPLPYPVRQPSRPRLITAIGVASITVGVLSGLASLSVAGSLFVFRVVATYGATLMQNAATARPATAPAPVPATSAPPASPRGLDAAARVQVASGLADLHFLSGPRLEQLDALLATAGRDMFPLDNAELSLTSDQAVVMVTNHTTGLSGDPSVPGPDIFRTKAGRFELYDDRAVFFPNRAPIVRVSTLTTSGAGLTAAQVDTVIQQAQSTAGNTLNPSQVAALRTLLLASGQQLVSPITIPTAIRSATPQEDGTVVLTFPNGYASLGPQGQTSSATGPGAAGSALAALASGRRVGVNGAAMALAVFAAVVALALAVFLFVIGILVMNNSPRGRRLHLVYAWLTIPVVLLGFAATWWLVTGVLDSSMSTPATPVAAYMAGRAAVIGALGLLYPITLLIVLQTRTVKDYYAA